MKEDKAKQSNKRLEVSKRTWRRRASATESTGLMRQVVSMFCRDYSTDCFELSYVDYYTGRVIEGEKKITARETKINSS